MAAARHLPVGLAEIDTTLNGFGLGHGKKSAEFAVKGAALEEGVELDLLKASGSAEALLVTRGDVTGSWLALGFRFGAF
jgi:hypothetical protein